MCVYIGEIGPIDGVGNGFGIVMPRRRDVESGLSNGVGACRARTRPSSFSVQRGLRYEMRKREIGLSFDVGDGVGIVRWADRQATVRHALAKP